MGKKLRETEGALKAATAQIEALQSRCAMQEHTIEVLRRDGQRASEQARDALDRGESMRVELDRVNQELVKVVRAESLTGAALAEWRGRAMTAEAALFRSRRAMTRLAIGHRAVIRFRSGAFMEDVRKRARQALAEAEEALG